MGDCVISLSENFDSKGVLMNLIILGKPSQSHGCICHVDWNCFYLLAADCMGVSDTTIFMTPESFLGSLLSYNPWLGWSWSNPIWDRSVKQTRPTQPAPVSLEPSTPVTVTKSLVIKRVSQSQQESPSLKWVVWRRWTLLVLIFRGLGRTCRESKQLVWRTPIQGQSLRGL